MSAKVLIVTGQEDLDADRVASALQARGGVAFRLNLDEFPARYLFDLKFSRTRWSGSIVRASSGEELQLSDVGAVWLRRPGEFLFESHHLSPQERAYATQETNHVLFSMLYTLECYWMSHPLAMRGAMWKGEQLLRASRMGFRVPSSIISNQPSSVRHFRAGVEGDVVFKALSSSFLGADQVPPGERIVPGIPTTRITDEHDEMIDAVKELPCFFQEHIKKKHELRVTIIDDRVFAARIHSQQDERTRVDFRDFSAEIVYELAELPPEIELRCLQFVHSYGLTYGAIDLIVTSDGQYVFLENNPAGQFLFVEQLVPQLKITEAVAACLMAGAASKGVVRDRISAS